MRVKATVLFAAFFTGVTIVSCDNPTSPATFENQDERITVYALNGTAANAPSAMSIRLPQAVVVSSNFAFDVAFDLNASNEVVIYSPRKLANQLAGVQRVGFQFTPTPFAQVTEAPSKNYVYDTAFVVPASQTVLVDVIDPACLGLIGGGSVRAKFTVDSVSLAKRAMYVHVLSDPNCGFKDLITAAPAVPKG